MYRGIFLIVLAALCLLSGSGGCATAKQWTVLEYPGGWITGSPPGNDASLETIDFKWNHADGIATRTRIVQPDGSVLLLSEVTAEYLLAHGQVFACKHFEETLRLGLVRFEPSEIYRVYFAKDTPTECSFTVKGGKIVRFNIASHNAQPPRVTFESPAGHRLQMPLSIAGAIELWGPPEQVDTIGGGFGGTATVVEYTGGSVQSTPGGDKTLLTYFSAEWNMGDAMVRRTHLVMSDGSILKLSEVTPEYLLKHGRAFAYEEGMPEQADGLAAFDTTVFYDVRLATRSPDEVSFFVKDGEIDSVTIGALGRVPSRMTFESPAGVRYQMPITVAQATEIWGKPIRIGTARYGGN